MNAYLIKAAALTYEDTIQVPVLDGDGNPTYDDNGDPIMEDQVIDVPFYPPGDFRAVVLVETLADGYVLNILHTEDPTLPGDSLIGAWSLDGVAVEPVDQALYAAIRPLGNNPPSDIHDENGEVIGQTRGGSATKQLIYHHFSGSGQRELGTPDPDTGEADFYPAGEVPFAIQVGHYWYEQAEFSGWGFLAEILGGAESRDPSARAMGVYSDLECQNYLWTGGAFQLGPSRLGQVDANGDPLEVWFSDTPAGFRTAEKEDWHLACLLGSAQEGFQTLGADDARIEYLFWEHNQEAPPPSGAEWIDTGATVTALAGTVIRISDAGVAASLVPGQQIRFGESLETTFTGLWAGGADYLEVDPYPTGVQVGDILWSWGSPSVTGVDTGRGKGRGQRKRK